MLKRKRRLSAAFPFKKFNPTRVKIMKNVRCQKRHLAICIALASSVSGNVYAQEVEQPSQQPQVELIEELVVTTRLKDSATAIVAERIEQPYAAEILGIEQISAVGDSSIASALRRVTGLTLIDGKFIYVRGLGERFSSTTLNGALIPSPDLTRNVVPLDLFPTSILNSLKVQKAYSADQPAAFGGGNIDIRTRSVPDGPLFNISIGTGYSSNNSGDGLEAIGDKGDLPSSIAQAIGQFQGEIDVDSIRTRLQQENPSLSALQADGIARQINRDLLLSVNRNIEIEEESIGPDLSGGIALGNSWFINDEWQFGALLNIEQSNKIRNEDQSKETPVVSGQDPITDEIQRSVEEKSKVAAVNFGLDYIGKHTVNTNSYVIRNDSDQARIARGFNENSTEREGEQSIIYQTNLEQRELFINQVTGSSNFEDGDFGFIYIPDFFLEVNVNWFYSDAKASTNLPSATNVQAERRFDIDTGETLSNGILSTTSAGSFNFLELEDNVESYGFSIDAPFDQGDFLGSFSGGYSRSVKDRQYEGVTVNLNTNSLGGDVLSGTPGAVFDNDNITTNGFTVSLGAGQGAESYVAAEILRAAHAGVDVTWQNTWRVSAGLRYEDFSRGLLPYDVLDFEGEQTRVAIEALQRPDQTLAFQDDEVYSSFAVTWIDNSGFLGAQDFQVRFGYGDTVVRPDLRELGDVVYQDQITNDNYRGNPFLQQSEIDHYDLRAEMFFDDGSNLTVSLFYKDIELPIETVEAATSSSNKIFTFINAEDGEVYGVEFEGLKELGNGFFVSGNVTLSDSEIDLGVNNNGQTNEVRRLTGHSKYVLNTQLGYDSADGKHSFLGAFNVFGERIVAGGREGDDDIFEQPFNSLDFVYSYFPNDNLTVKFKVQNLLDEEVEHEQKGSTGDTFEVLRQEKGINAALDLSWDF